MFYAGIDIAKRSHEAAVIGADGQALVESLSFANSQAGCEKLCQLFERLRISQQELVIGMEATGHYWLALYAYLTEQGYTVQVINPIQSDAFAGCPSVRPRRMPLMFLIAQIMRFGQYPPRHCRRRTLSPCGNCHAIASLWWTSVDCKRRVVALLDRVFPEYERLFQRHVWRQFTGASLALPDA